MNDLKASLIVLLYLALELQAATVTYCSAICSGTVCTSPWPTDCSTCQLPLVLSSGSCAVSGQASIFTQELLMYSSFTPVGYQSNSTLSVVKCTGLFDYYMLGTLGSSSYVQKTYTKLGVNHYQLTVLYGYALMGTTAWSQQLKLQLIDGGGTVTNNLQTPTCTPDGLSGCLWSAGCYQNYAVSNLAHSWDTLSLNFSLSGTLSAGQAWGIRDIIIILTTCDPSCGTCSGPAASNCLTCATGLYFSGTICIASCPYLTMPDSNICVISCPAYYFLNAVNSYCQPCPFGCQACTSTEQCITWDAGANSSNLFRDLIGVWIILIVVGLFLIGLLIWRLCFAKKSFYNSMEEEVIDHKPVAKQQQTVVQINQSHEVMATHWIEDIDDLHMTKAVKKRVPKDTIEGIGRASEQLR